MNCEIIAVGTELLLGQITNSNARFLSEQLSMAGINVFYHTVVGDNKNRLLSALEIAEARADLVITTGGLGPTIDDLTKETVFEFLGLKSKLNDKVLNDIQCFFHKIGRDMTNNNIKQAMFPENAIILDNNKGTAPGAIINMKERVYVVLPGPPYEMQPMFLNHVYPYLKKLNNQVIKSRVLKLFGIGESAVEEKIKDVLINQTNPTVAPLAKFGEVTIRITAKAKNDYHASKMIKPTEDTISDILGDAVYGFDNDTMESVVIKFLSDRNKKLALAESCTGGLICKMITDISGASKVFDRGLITYSNNSKIQLLGVKPETIETYGAVSEQCAREMAEGILNKYNADLGLSVTGIAGPDGGSADKPVGLAFIGLSDKRSTSVEKYLFPGDRDTIRKRTALASLNLIRLALLKDNDDVKK